MLEEWAWTPEIRKDGRALNERCFTKTIATETLPLLSFMFLINHIGTNISIFRFSEVVGELERIPAHYGQKVFLEMGVCGGLQWFWFRKEERMPFKLDIHIDSKLSEQWNSTQRAHNTWQRIHKLKYHSGLLLWNTCESYKTDITGRKSFPFPRACLKNKLQMWETQMSIAFFFFLQFCNTFASDLFDFHRSKRQQQAYTKQKIKSKNVATCCISSTLEWFHFTTSLSMN